MLNSHEQDVPFEFEISLDEGRVLFAIDFESAFGYVGVVRSVEGYSKGSGSWKMDDGFEAWSMLSGSEEGEGTDTLWCVFWEGPSSAF